MNSLKKKVMVLQLEKDTRSAHTKIYQLQDNTRSNQESLRVHSTQFMKEESKRLKQLQAQENMNSKKREHMDSQSEKDLKNEDQRICLLLVSMNLNLTLLKVHNTLSTREEKRRLRLQLVQENMKLLMRKDTDLQLVKN